MSLVATFSLFLGAFASLLFLAAFFLARYLYVKPSMQVLLYTHLFLQWPAALAYPAAEAFLPRPLEFFLLVHGFVFTGLIFSVSTFNKTAREVFDRVTGAPLYQRKARISLVFLGALLIAGLIHYLSVVPLDRTGLVVAFLNPTDSGSAREESLKLLDSQLTKYVFSITASSLTPMVGVMVMGLTFQFARQRRLAGLCLSIIALVILLATISLTGARTYSALFLLTLVVAGFFSRGLKIRFWPAAVALACVLAPAVFLSLLREGKTDDLQYVAEYIWLVVGYRMFELPSEVGLWYVHHAQTAGPIGIAGIPKLAWLLGAPAINAPNEIGLSYFDATLSTVTANAGYLFSYYGYFGLASLATSLVLLCLLDLTLPILKRLDNGILLPTVATMAVNALSFVQMEYTIALVTNGFATTLAVAALASFLSRSVRPTTEIPAGTIR